MIGESAALKLWNRYAGLTITFPRKLYSKKYTRRFIEENMNELTPGELALQTSLTERRVRQIIKEIRNERNEESK